MGKPDAQTASLTMLAVTSSIGMYTSLLPSFSEVRKADHSDVETRNDVRMGEIAAGALAVSIGLMAASMAGTPIPAVVAIVVAVGVTAMYENVLNTTPKEKAKK